MTASVSINPQLVSNAAGLFFSTSEGLVAGTIYDDPVARFAIQSGIVSLSASTPIWGGCGIVDNLPLASAENLDVGSVLALATSQANLTGFTVFNQSAALIQSAQSPVPYAAAGMFINFVRLGSGARIAVAVSQADAATLAGAASNVALYWDYTNQVLKAAPGGTAIAAKLLSVDAVGNSRTVSYASATGFATWNNTGYCAVIQI